MKATSNKIFILINFALFALFFSMPDLKAQVKIMPLGNSITYDQYVGDTRGTTDRVAYRNTLYRLLKGEGIDFDFVGNRSAGIDSIGNLEYCDVAGFPGITTAQMITLINTGWNGVQSQYENTSNSDSPYLTDYPADIILLHIGTNGVVESSADVETLLTTIRSYLPNAVILVAKIINQLNNSSSTTTIHNTNVTNYVNSLGDSKIIMVDIESGAGINYYTEMRDQWHPYESGYGKIAGKWFEALMALNSAPVISTIPEQTTTEGQNFTNLDLRNYTTDSDQASSTLTDWEYTYSADPHVSVTISGGIASVSPSASWAGKDSILFKITDDGNGNYIKRSDSIYVVFNVEANNAPVGVADSYSGVSEGGTLNISSPGVLSNDTDDEGDALTAELVSTVSHGSLTLNSNGSFVYTHDGGSSTTDQFTYRPDDGTDGSVATVSIVITPVNDLPIVGDIPGQTIFEDATFATINLDNYVSDEEDSDSDIHWSYSGASSLSVNISSGRIATITAPANWFGSETITFTAEDTDGATDSDAALFTVNSVNDAPVVGDIPNQNIEENSTFSAINLDGYVSDVEDLDSEITWSYSGNTELTVNLLNRVASVIVPADWNGSETITFTAQDTEGATGSDAAIFTVNSVNDAPVVGNIPNQTILEDGTFTTINLDNYVEDLEDADSDIDWTYSGNTYLTVSIVSRVATITAPADWNGTETITFTAEDLDGGTDSDAAIFTVTSVNDAPVVDNIPNQTILEDGAFATINLDNYVEDVEDLDSDISWSYSDNTYLTVSIVNRIATITAPANWSGSETIIFEAKDTDNATDSDGATFKVTAVNDAPVVGDIPNQTKLEDGTFTTINLDNYVSDIEDLDSEITWSYSGNIDLIVSISSSRIATITAPANWNGSETIIFEAEDTDGATDSDAAIFEMTSVNDVPAVSNIPNQTKLEDGTFTTINLDLFVEDVEDLDSEITWSYSGNTALTVSVSASRVATITAPANWNGSETITFEAEDTDGGKDSDDVIFTMTPVNDAPVAVDDNGGSIDEDTQLQLTNISINDTDVDGTVDASTIVLIDPNDASNKGVTGNPLEIVEIGTYSIDVAGKLIYTPIENYNGPADIYYTIEDNEGLVSNQATISITVDAVNDIPESVDDVYNLTEGGTITGNVLTNDIDVDEDVLEVGSIVKNVKHGVLTLDTEDGSFTYIHDGSETVLDSFTYRANDGTANGNIAIARFIIEPVNDPPYFENFTQITRNEGSDTTAIILSNYAKDSESLVSELTYSIGTPYPTNISSYINEDTLFLFTPDTNWFGSEKIYLNINDNDPSGNEVTRDTINIIVNNVDDYPYFTVDTIHITPSDEDEVISSFYLDPSVYIEELDGDDLILEIPTGDTTFTFTNTNYLIQASVPENYFGERYFEFYIVDDTPEQLRDTIVLHYTINPVDDPPVIISQINNLTVLEDASSIVYDLHNVFDDVDNTNEEMDFSLWISNENVVNANINSEDKLVLTFLEDRNTTSGAYGYKPTISVTCNSNGESVSNSFNVTVTAVNDAPTFTTSGDVILIGNEVAQYSEVTVTKDPVPSDECDLACTTYSLSPTTVSFATVSINDRYGTVYITIPAGAVGQKRFTITANDGEDTASKTFLLSVNQKGEQTISFTEIPDKTLQDEFVVLEATATSGLPVSFEIVSGLATISNDSLYILGAGEIEVVASQDGNDDYEPAPDVSQTFTVSKLTQEITFDEILDKTYGDENFELNATSTSGLDITFQVLYGPLTILNTSTVQINGVGEAKIVAHQDGNSTYAEADTVSRIFTINKADQSLQFDEIADQVYSDEPITLSATSTSGLPVSYTVLSGSAQVKDGELTITGAGTISVQASQSGNGFYNPAESIVRTFEIFKASQTLTFEPLSDTTYGSFVIPLYTEISSGLPVQFIIQGPVELSNSSLSIIGTGTVYVSALHPGDDRYFPTDTITRSFAIDKATQSILLEQEETEVFGLDGVAITATASSGLDLVFEVVSGPATAEGNVISPDDYGKVEFRVVQEGNENYSSASVESSITFIESVYDLEVLKFVSPTSWDDLVMDRSEAVTIRIRNIGNREIGAFNVSYYVDKEDDADKLVSEYYSSTLEAGDSIDYSFSTLWTPRDVDNDVCVFIESESDGNEINDSICLPLHTSIHSISFDDDLISNVYPNPASDFIYFSFGGNVQEGDLVIYNTSGAVIEQHQITSNVNKLIFEVNISKYRQGTYYYKFISDDKFNSGKFIVY